MVGVTTAPTSFTCVPTPGNGVVYLTVPTSHRPDYDTKYHGQCGQGGQGKADDPSNFICGNAWEHCKAWPATPLHVRHSKNGLLL